MLFLAILFIGISRKIYRDANKLKEKHGIQKGKIAYSDLDKPGKPFFSKRFRITGKPDYIVKKNKRYIPVEVKTGSRTEPQKNHIFQLASYCQLLEENYGGFVPYGILVYNNSYQYKIPFDPKLRYEFEYTLRTMRNIMRTGKISRNHDFSFRCKSCSMRTYCDVKIM